MSHATQWDEDASSHFCIVKLQSWLLLILILPTVLVSMLEDLKKAVDGQESDEHKQGGQMAWLTDLLEPAMKLYRRALPAGMHATLSIVHATFAALLL